MVGVDNSTELLCRHPLVYLQVVTCRQLFAPDGVFAKFTFLLGIVKLNFGKQSIRDKQQSTGGAITPSLVDSTVPTILLPQVRVPSTPYALNHLMLNFVLYLKVTFAAFEAPREDELCSCKMIL